VERSLYFVFALALAYETPIHRISVPGDRAGAHSSSVFGQFLRISP
jgi:hypothetical protein